MSWEEDFTVLCNGWKFFWFVLLFFAWVFWTNQWEIFPEMSQKYLPNIQLVLPTVIKQGHSGNLYSHRSLMSAFPSINFLRNTLIHSPWFILQLLSSSPIFVPPALLALNTRSRTNGFVTALAAALSHRLWSELWAAEEKPQDLSYSSWSLSLSILNGVWVPQKSVFLARSQEAQQNLVLPTLSDKSVYYCSTTVGSHQS